MRFNLVLIAATTLMTLAAGSAQAATPRIQAYNVNTTGSETLNLRQNAGANSLVQYTLPANARVFSRGEEKQVGASTWIRVQYEAIGGWVNKRYLRPNPVISHLTKTRQDLTRKLKCGGTEPFWNTSFKGNRLQVTDMSNDSKYQATVTERRYDAAHHYIIAGKTELFIQESGQCSDGMSDRNYPYNVIMLKANNDFRTGCCE